MHGGWLESLGDSLGDSLVADWARRVALAGTLERALSEVTVMTAGWGERRQGCWLLCGLVVSMMEGWKHASEAKLCLTARETVTGLLGCERQVWVGMGWTRSAAVAGVDACSVAEGIGQAEKKAEMVGAKDLKQQLRAAATWADRHLVAREVEAED